MVGEYSRDLSSNSNTWKIIFPALFPTTNNVLNTVNNGSKENLWYCIFTDIKAAENS